MKLQIGDKVAVLSPSSTIAGVYTWVFQQGLQRIRDIFKLEPVIMPNCLNIKATQRDRANDLHAAFSDPDIKAIIACTGGIDQIQLIPHLQASIFQKNPKLFFGYSDNTHLCNFLFNNGIPSAYGGSVLTQFAMQYEMDAATVRSLKWAFFEQGSFEANAPTYAIDEDLAWDDPTLLNQKRPTENRGPFCFDGKSDAEGILWGGCLESLNDLMRIHSRMPAIDKFSQIILFLETSEELPSHEFVRRFMISIGEAGCLSKIRGLILGRPKAWFFDNKQSSLQKEEYRKIQATKVLNTFRQYNSTAPMVWDVNIGHTDPQMVVPYGGTARIACEKKKLSFSFSRYP